MGQDKRDAITTAMMVGKQHFGPKIEINFAERSDSISRLVFMGIFLGLNFLFRHSQLQCIEFQGSMHLNASEVGD